MKHTTLSKVISAVLCVAMLFSLLPVAVYAWDNVVYDGATFGTNGYYNVISQKEYTLVPGAATETEMVINNSSGTRRQVMHIIEVDPSNPDISIVPGYYGIDTDLSDINNWKVAGVTETVSYYENNLGYNVVGAMNTSLAYDNNAPIDFLVYNGVNLSQGKHQAQTFLAVIKDPDTGAISCELHSYADGIPENCWQAVSANFGFTVKNGQLVNKTEERTSSAAARSMLGVKEDGTLVIVMNDGRGANNSVGFCTYELGESMLALGCKWAVNCDGGGSSSFVTKRAGETVNTMRCVPCDGSERPTINSILITSNVGPTGELNNVDIVSGYDYFAPGTAYSFSANAIDTHGYAMDMPADMAWALSDASFGTISNGVFSSNGMLGDVDVQVVSGGEVVGSKTIHVANPTTLTLSATSTTLPYSTADKPRTVTLPIVAKIGEADVYYDADSFSVSSSVASAGTLNGLTFTATTDETVEGTVLTATYLPTGQELVFTISFGKGSEILWDFEDQDISNWYGGSEDVKAWLTEHGVPEADQLKTLISGGQISFSEQSHTFLSTKENGGQVHNGDSALGVSFDFRNVEFNSWVYALLYNIQDQYVLRDVANGKKATALGMWCYVPEGFCNPAGDTSGALAMQLTVYKNPQGTSGTQLNFQFYSEYQKKRVSLNQCTEADIPENRWIYLTADLTGSDYYSLTNPYGTTYREPSFFRMYIKPTRAQVLTYYFDDFTLDYSSAVDDRDAPVITNPTYCINDTNIDLDGQTIDTNTVSFDANIADYAASNAEGLNYASAAIYADGVKLSGVTASGSNMGVKNVRLSDGTHAIKFEIYDNAGNFSSVTKYITVDADPTKAVVTISGHNDLNNVPECDSVYYVDLVASDITQISSITTELQLNTANHWELDHMIAAKGFEASYSYNEISKIATVTVTKTGETELTGQQILVSIPARVWIFDENTDVGGDGSSSQHMTIAERFNSSYGEPKVFVDVKVVSGSIGYADSTNGTFGGSISIATKLTGNKANGMWHQHSAEAVEDVAPTCLESGYTGRTYCQVCGSVVDWGTTLPATGHDYQLVGGTFVCSVCGDTLTLGTGLIEVNGKYYYAISGNLVSGWQQIEDDYYYFDPATYTVVETLNNGYVTYTFEPDGKLTHGEWYTTSQGTRYFYGPTYWTGKQSADKMVVIDGNIYYFNKYGYRMEGHKYVKLSNQDIYQWYDFGDDGILRGEWDYTGFAEQDGYLYYVIDGLSSYGMHYVDGAYYYSASPNRFAVVMDIERYCPVTNGLLPADTYRFGADGKMLNEVVYCVDGTLYYFVLGKQSQGSGVVNFNDVECAVDESGKVDYTGYALLPDGRNLYFVNGVTGEWIKNGLFHDEDGEIRYYVDGVPTRAGLVKDTDGSYYYINSTLKAVKNCTYTISEAMTNGLLPGGKYSFGADGRMIDPPDQTEPTEPTDPPEVKNGLVHDEDGEIRYYVDGVPTRAGLVKDTDGSYYYINSTKKAVKNCAYSFSDTMANGLMPGGTYHFDENGVMTDPRPYDET